jgi:hypothetical protein
MVNLSAKAKSRPAKLPAARAHALHKRIGGDKIGV